MGSAIGNYVHYRAENYLRHGAGRAGRAVMGYNSPRKQMRERVAANSVKNSASLAEMEEMLSSIQKGAEEFAQDYKDQIAEDLGRSFQDRIQSVDMQNMSVTAFDTAGDKMGKISAHRMDGRLGFDVKKITGQIEKLETILATIVNTQKLSAEELAEIQNYKTQLKKLYKDVYGQTMAQVRRNGYRVKATNPAAASIGALRDLANEAIDLYAKYPAIALYEGTLWENTLAVLAYTAAGSGYNSIQEAIAGAVKGSQNVSLAFNADAFGTTKSIKDNFGNRVHIDAKGEISRRSKVDVSFSWNGEDIKMSAKNIAINNKWHWVTVVSGSPLLTMVAGMDAAFVNHYLNVYSLHEGGRALHDDRGIGNDMRLSLFYQALTGDNLTSQVDSANVFAVNDKVSGKFRLVPIGRLIGELENNLGAISVTMNGIPIQKYHFQNKFAKTQDQRIANLINALHQAKVSASFDIGRTSVFK